MTIPNPEHFFEQAEQLVSSSASRRPRQVDLRRAISNAYYAVFHATVRAAADHIVGRSARADYDPLADFKRSDAHIAISLGRRALQRFERARDSERDSFLNLLLFPPR